MTSKYNHEEYMRTKQRLQELSAAVDSTRARPASAMSPTKAKVHPLTPAVHDSTPLATPSVPSPTSTSTDLEQAGDQVNAFDLDLERRLGALEPLLMEILDRFGVRFTADVKLKAAVAECKQLQRQARASWIDRIQSVKSGGMNASQIATLKAQHETALREARQQEADLIRKLRAQYTKQLEAQAKTAREDAKTELLKEMATERETWRRQTKAAMDHEYASMADVRAKEIESKLARLERDYAAATLKHADQLAAAQEAQVEAEKHSASKSVECAKLAAELRTVQVRLTDSQRALERARGDISMREASAQRVEADARALRQEANLEKDALYRQLKDQAAEDAQVRGQLREQCAALTTTIAQLKQHHAIEMENEKRRRQSELDDVSNRVRAIVAKKDSQLAQVQEQLINVQHEASVMRQAMERQTRELLQSASFE